MAEIEQTGLQRVAATGGSGGSPVEQASAMLRAMRLRLAAMPEGKRTWLIASVVLIVAVSAGLAWYAQRPDWRVLFSGLDGKDLQQVSQELAAAGIPYEMSMDGSSVDVPAEMLDKARMEVAAKGMPQTGRLGFELFDKPNWVGSEFDERVNYQRALEGELEHTIETLSAVRSARVHLVLPQQSLFAAETKLAKASVVLKLKRAAMDAEQVEAIRSLVAGSVENLSVDQVTLVDADGRVSLKPRGKDSAMSDQEQAMETKLVAMLEPLAGRDNVRATVNISYDEDTVDRTDEVYDPSQVAAVTMKKSEQNSAQQRRASGVPGTASNSPGAAAAGAVAGSQAAAAPGTPPLLQKEALPVYPQSGGVGQSVRQENGTFAVSKHIIHSEENPGRVRRVTAAVLVNDRSGMEGVGKLEHAVWKPRSADEMHRLEQLAQASVGFDGKRGYEVVVENVSFSTNAPPAKLPAMDQAVDALRGAANAQPGLMRTMMIGLCGVLLVLFVLRPLVQQVSATMKEPLLLMEPSREIGVRKSIEPQQIPLSVPAGLQDRSAMSIEASRVKAEQRGIYEHVTEHIRRDPVQSTRLLEAWIGPGEESE